MSEQRAIAAVPAAPVDLTEVRAHRAVALPTMTDVRSLLEFGSVLVKSGLLPATVNSPEKAAVILLKGQELGVPPMAAMEGIAVVQGKAAVGAHLMLALVKRAYGTGAIWVSESTAERCTVSYRLPGHAETLSYSYTIRDATTAGLAGSGTWAKHPAAMLRARCISATCKMAFPEVVGGLYVAGEIEGTAAVVTDDGDVVVDISAAPPAEPAPERSPEPRRQQARASVRPVPPPAAPEPEAEADPPVADGNGITQRQLRRLGALVRQLPVDAPEGTAPAAVRTAQDRALRRALLEVAGVESRKHLTREQADEAALALEALSAELDAEGVGLRLEEPAAPTPAQGVIDADFGPAVDGGAGDDHRTR